MEYQPTTYDQCIVEDSIETYHLSPQNESASSRCIFYIDDCEMDRWLAKHVLESSGLCRQIVIASNGEEGIKAIEAHYLKTHQLPDIIIADLLMPRMDGFQLISELKKLPYFSEKDCKVILISAGLDDEDREKINALKIKYVLLKPFDQEHLTRLL